ncbi:MAG TPA: hypothetical protein VK670_08435 [Silvibacterium sp.]|nr:hypothetical protein [Silvibacterium sp.]
MKQLTPNKTALGTLLACVIFAVAGCHRNQSAANSGTPNAATQTATQPANTVTPPSTAAAPPSTSSTAAPPAPAAPAPVSATPATAPSGAAASTTPPTPADAQQASSAPPQPAPVVVPEGTTLRIRINQHISVKTSHAGDSFDGTIVDPVTANGSEVIPAGSLAQGRVVEAHRRGHFKGRSVLELRLVGLDVNGRHYRVDTSTVARTKKGKGKRTAAFIGGGAGLGMLIGGIASGGAGLVIGGLSGAGAGTLGAAFTGNRDIDIPAETVMSFRLAQPIELR